VSFAKFKSHTVSVLLVEDDPDDALLVREMLENSRRVQFEVFQVTRLADARQRLLVSSPGCVLLDLSLPDARWLEAPSEFRALAPTVPVVIMSGQEDELLAVQAVQQGAQDYLVKGNIPPRHLVRSILYAIERKRAELETSQDFMWDALTGLPKRALFVDRLQQALVRQRQRGWSLAVLLVDLEGLKVINKCMGRPLGDEVLAGVAGRLREALRERDTAARFGGDKFAIVCENTSGAEHRAQIVRSVLKRMEEPFVIDGEDLFVDARIGVAIARHGAADPEELIRDAQIAVQVAKEQGVSSELHGPAVEVSAGVR
jgi:diguanylate cyclase (GGDEF)-like protein